MSWFLHKTNRIGFIEDEPFVTDGMETVDATAVDTGLWGHSYFSDQRSVITDMGYLLANGLPDFSY